MEIFEIIFKKYQKICWNFEPPSLIIGSARALPASSMFGAPVCISQLFFVFNQPVAQNYDL